MNKRNLCLVLFLLLIPALAAAKEAGIEGKIQDGKGQPLAKVKVRATQVQPLKGYEKFETTTDSDGVFRFDELYPSSEYVLFPWSDSWTTMPMMSFRYEAEKLQTYFNKDGWMTERKMVFRSGPDKETSMLVSPVIIQPAKATVEGKVVDAKGQPLPDIQVIMRQAKQIKGYEEFSTVTASDGGFAIDRLFPDSDYFLLYYQKERCSESMRLQSPSAEQKMTLPQTLVLRFICSDDGVIADSKTDLQWFIIPGQIDWSRAQINATQLGAGGYHDWRLPTVSELRTLEGSFRGKKEEIHPAFAYKEGYLWSSESGGWQGRDRKVFSFRNAYESTSSPNTTANHCVFAVRKENPEDRVKPIIEEIGKLIGAKKYAEADQKLAYLDKKFPNVQESGILAGAWERSLVDHRRILDQELGRVDKAIQKDTFSLEGVVTQKSEMEGSGGFWGFELQSDDGNKYVFMCNASDTLYFKLKESNIDTYEGYEQLKNVHDRIKLYIPNSQKEYVTGNCKNQECNGICPTAIIMFPSTSKHVQTPSQPQAPQPTTAKAGEIIQFKLEKPIGTVTVKPDAYLCTDPATQQKGRQVESATSLEINGFVRNESNMVSALQTILPGQTAPSYVAVEDVTEFKQTNDVGAYLEILLASTVFNRGGKVGSKETMKSIDTYLVNYPQSQFAPNAMLDYLLCLEWLFLNDKAVNKDAIVRLAEMYVEKAKQRFPDALQTKKCESVVLSMKNPSAEKQSKKDPSGENTFVILREMHGNDGSKTGEFTVQPGWVAKKGEIQKLAMSDHPKIPSLVYWGGNGKLKLTVSSEPQKVSVDCEEYTLKTAKGSSLSQPFASSEPLSSDFGYTGKDVEKLGEAAVQKALAVAKEKSREFDISVTTAKGKIVEAVDLDKDSVPEFGVDVEVKMAKPKEYEIVGEVSSLRGLVWLKVKSPEQIDVLFNGFEASGGTPLGYQCDGIADFDGDGVGEVAQHVVWGEAGSSLEIYKLKNDKLEKIFESETIGGC